MDKIKLKKGSCTISVEPHRADFWKKEGFVPVSTTTPAQEAKAIEKPQEK